MSSTVTKAAGAGKSRILPFFLLFIGVFLVFTGITLTVLTSVNLTTCGFVFIALGLICLLGSLYILLWKGNNQGPFVTRVKVYHHPYSSAFTTCLIFIRFHLIEFHLFRRVFQFFSGNSRKLPNYLCFYTNRRE